MLSRGAFFVALVDSVKLELGRGKELSYLQEQTRRDRKRIEYCVGSIIIIIMIFLNVPTSICYCGSVLGAVIYFQRCTFM